MLIVQKHDAGLVIKSNHPWQGRTGYFCGVLSPQMTSLSVFLFLLILGENELENSPVQEKTKKEKNFILIFSLGLLKLMVANSTKQELGL